MRTFVAISAESQRIHCSNATMPRSDELRQLRVFDEYACSKEQILSRSMTDHRTRRCSRRGRCSENSGTRRTGLPKIYGTIPSVPVIPDW